MQQLAHRLCSVTGNETVTVTEILLGRGNYSIPLTAALEMSERMMSVSAQRWCAC